MSILVTGATGFLGLRVVKILLSLGYTVHAISRNTSKFHKVTPNTNLSFISFDIIQNSVQDLALPPCVDTVIHLAWGDLHQYNDPKHTSLYPSKHLQFLQHLLNAGIKDFTIIGTSFEYGLQEGALAEDMPCAPVTEYGKGKLALYHEFSKQCQKSNISLKWLRLFYIYADDQATRTLWGQLRQAYLNKAIEFNMSQGDQVRDYLHADEVAEMITSASLQNDIKNIINIGQGYGTAVIDLVQKFMQQHSIVMQLNRGFYPYPTHEPFAFWANTEKITHICAKKTVKDTTWK